MFEICTTNFGSKSFVEKIAISVIKKTSAEYCPKKLCSISWLMRIDLTGNFRCNFLRMFTTFHLNKCKLNFK